MTGRPPLTPPDCDLRSLPSMPVDVQWVRDGRLSVIATPAEWRAGFMLFLGSWHSVPAASLPNNDRELAKLAGVSLRRWRRLRDVALTDWLLCDDGRLYHPVAAERANAVWPKVQAWGRRINRRLEIMTEEWAALRIAVFTRDNFTCTYCGAREVRLECDHIVPVIRGGKSVEENLTTACKPCNRSKGAKLLEAWQA